MALYEIFNIISGTSLGEYIAENPSDALDAMARDAGYKNYADACDVAPVLADEITVTKIG